VTARIHRMSTKAVHSIQHAVDPVREGGILVELMVFSLTDTLVHAACVTRRFILHLTGCTRHRRSFNLQVLQFARNQSCRTMLETMSTAVETKKVHGKRGLEGEFISSQYVMRLIKKCQARRSYDFFCVKSSLSCMRRDESR
jgi:hypothetical protein